MNCGNKSQLAIRVTHVDVYGKGPFANETNWTQAADQMATITT